MRLSTIVVEQAGCKQRGDLATHCSRRYDRKDETTWKDLDVLTEGRSWLFQHDWKSLSREVAWS